MATEKQIAANRRNAQRSTGPRSAAGKSISSRNAFRHGLSLPANDDTAKDMIDRLARTIIEEERGAFELADANEWAAAQWDLYRVKKIRRTLFADLDLGNASPEQLQLFIATDRYDSRARTRRRRAAVRLKATTGWFSA